MNIILFVLCCLIFNSIQCQDDILNSFNYSITDNSIILNDDIVRSKRSHPHFIAGSFKTDSTGNITSQVGNFFYVYYNSYYNYQNIGEFVSPGEYIVTFLKPFCVPVSIILSSSVLVNSNNNIPSLIFENNLNSLNGQSFIIANVPIECTITFLVVPII
jgi:hypothetical protein